MNHGITGKEKIGVMFAGVLFFLATCVAIVLYESSYIENLLQSLVSDEVGAPITFDDFETRWFGFPPYFSIQNVRATSEDKEILSIKQIDIHVGVLKSIVNKQLMLSHIHIDGLSWHIFDEGGEFSYPEVPHETLDSIFERVSAVTVTNSELNMVNQLEKPFLIQSASLALSRRVSGNFVDGDVVTFWDKKNHFYFSALLNKNNELEAALKGGQVDIKPWFGIFGYQQYVESSKVDFSWNVILKGNSVHESKVNFLIHDLSLKNNITVKNVSGVVETTLNTSQVSLDSDELEIDFPSLFEKDFNFKQFHTKMVYHSSSPKQVILKSLDAKVFGGEVSGQGELFQDSSIDDWQLLSNVKVNSFQIKDIHAFYPKTMSKGLYDWLTASLQSGKVSSGEMKLSGKLNDFPYLDLHEGFSWQAELDEITLQYAPGWPEIQDLKATIGMTGRDLYVNASDGVIKRQARLYETVAQILDLGKTDNPIAQIHGHVDASLPVGVEFLNSSPLEESFGHKIESLSPMGRLSLDLKLEVPLGTDDEVKTDGVIHLQDASLNIPETNLSLDHLSGNLSFSQNSFYGKDLKGTFLENLGTLDVDLLADETLKVSMSSELDLDVLQKQFELTIPNRISGKMPYQVDLIYPTKGGSFDYRLDVYSDTTGMEMTWPKPFNKVSHSKVPLKFSLEESGLKQKWVFSLENYFNGEIISRRDTDKINLLGAHIYLGKNKEIQAIEEAEIAVSGELEMFNFDDWFKRDESFHFEHPFKVNLLLKEVNIWGQNFKNSMVSFRTIENQFNIDGLDIKGSIRLPSKNNSVFKLNFDKLVLKKGKADSFSNDLSLGENGFEVELSVKVLELDKERYGPASAYLQSENKKLNMNNVVFTANGLQYVGQGVWDTSVSPVKTELKGNVSSQNVGVALNTLGYPDTIHGGKGDFEFDLTWQGAPFHFDLSKITGKSKFNLKSGQLIGVDPGLGRVLGLLSLDNIQRRLQLDFSDIFQDGMSFDVLTAKVVFKDSRADSDYILIDGPAARIELYGGADILTREVDFRMAVTPKVSGTLPVAAAIAAANPAVGAAVWLFDKATGSKFQAIANYYYRVSGTWDKPEITEIRQETSSSNQ